MQRAIYMRVSVQHLRTNTDPLATARAALDLVSLVDGLCVLYHRPVLDVQVSG